MNASKRTYTISNDKKTVYVEAEDGSQEVHSKSVGAGVKIQTVEELQALIEKLQQTVVGQQERWDDRDDQQGYKAFARKFKGDPRADEVVRIRDEYRELKLKDYEEARLMYPQVKEQLNTLIHEMEADYAKERS